MFLATKRFDPNLVIEEEVEVEPVQKKLKVTKDGNGDVDTARSDDGIKVNDNSSNNNDNDSSEDEIQIDPKYLSVFKRFQDISSRVLNDKLTVGDATREASDKVHEHKGEGDDEGDLELDQPPIEVNDLVPLPQIERKRDHSSKHKKEPPKWITEPINIPINASTPFEEFHNENHISTRMLNVLKSQNFTSAFAVQSKVCPVLLKDSQSISPDPLPDVLVNAYTGSGKTLAYGIPIVESLANRTVPRIRALILLPTRPLAQQVRIVLESLAKGTSLRVMICRTDRPFKEEQKLLTNETPDILITTPGRLVDHIRNETEGFSLTQLKYLVVDEADRLLNQSFQEWVPILNQSLQSVKPKQDTTEVWYRPPQKLIFSATLTRDPGKLAALDITTTPLPRIFVIGEDKSINHDNTDTSKSMTDYEFSLPEQLKEYHISIKSSTNKPLTLLQLLVNHNLKSDTLIFVKSNQAAARLARLIQLIDEEIFHLNLKVERCSGELELSQRRKMLNKFANREIDILVCTDLIARGIDISSIRAVINYDLPVGKREYVHRVGRTARAGNSGSAFNLTVGSGERKFFFSIANSIYRTGEVEPETILTNPDHNELYQQALSRLEEEVFSK